MKCFQAIILILIFSSFGYSKGNYFAYRTYKVQPNVYERTYAEGTAYTYNAGEASPDDFSFPIFSKTRINAYAANKINQTLQISELEILKGFETKSIFERISFDGGGIYGKKVSIKFKVYDNNNKVLSVKINNSSCGATCAYRLKYYNFNSGNGDMIQLQDLFTEKDFTHFFTLVTKRRAAQLKREIRKKIPKDERSGFDDISGSYESDELSDFYIHNNILYIDGENSFSKNQKFSGIKTTSKFKLSEFKPYLNEYGKSLFGLNNKVIKKYRSNYSPQLFQGKIGDQKVVLFFNIDNEDEINAQYVYLKDGKGIFLEGKLKENKLSLTEKIPKPRENGFIDYVDNGLIEANFDGQNITGTWANQDKTEFYTLTLSRK